MSLCLYLRLCTLHNNFIRVPQNAGNGVLVYQIKKNSDGIPPNLSKFGARPPTFWDGTLPIR